MARKFPFVLNRIYSPQDGDGASKRVKYRIYTDKDHFTEVDATHLLNTSKGGPEVKGEGAIKRVVAKKGNAAGNTLDVIEFRGRVANDKGGFAKFYGSLFVQGGSMESMDKAVRKELDEFLESPEEYKAARKKDGDKRYLLVATGEVRMGEVSYPAFATLVPFMGPNARARGLIAVDVNEPDPAAAVPAAETGEEIPF